MKNLTLALFALLAAGQLYGADLNPRDIVERSIFNYDKDWNAALDFSYTERDVTIDPVGASKTTDVSRVFILDGTPYTRLVGKNGHPLSQEDALRENEKYQKALSIRDHETAEERARRIRKYQEERRFLHEIPDAFNMKLLGHETLRGRENYLVELTPKPDYVPKSRNARMFSAIAGKLWIDEQDLRWTRAEARVIDTISIGWFVARIGPGAHILMRQVKVDDEHWMPKEIQINGTVKIMLIRNRVLNQIMSFSDYKRVRPSAGSAAAKNGQDHSTPIPERPVFPSNAVR